MKLIRKPLKKFAPELSDIWSLTIWYIELVLVAGHWYISIGPVPPFAINVALEFNCIFDIEPVLVSNLNRNEVFNELLLRSCL